MILNPIVLLPVPIVLFLIALLAYAATRYVDRMPIYPTWARPRPSTARHRMTPAVAADPYRRDWAASQAERINGAFPLPAPPEPEQPKITYGLLDPEVPLAEVEEYLRSIGVADWYQPLTEFERRAGVPALDGPTLELEGAK